MLRHIPEIFYLLPKVGDIFRANKGEKRRFFFIYTKYVCVNIFIHIVHSDILICLQMQRICQRQKEALTQCVIFVQIKFCCFTRKVSFHYQMMSLKTRISQPGYHLNLLLVL